TPGGLPRVIVRTLGGGNKQVVQSAALLRKPTRARGFCRPCSYNKERTPNGPERAAGPAARTPRKGRSHVGPDANGPRTRELRRSRLTPQRQDRGGRSAHGRQAQGGRPGRIALRTPVPDAEQRHPPRGVGPHG